MPSRLLHQLHHGFLYHLIRLCRIRAASEQVARGFSIGLIPHFFPTFGLGAIISAFLARACGGNGMAGLIAGALFAPFWPAFFYVNMKVGSLILQSRDVIVDIDDVTGPKVQALVWGRDFTVGAVICGTITCVSVYLILVAIYERIRPHLLKHFRHQARTRKKTRRLVPA
jgi:uncharacterized protein (DUF2062 family)